MAGSSVGEPTGGGGGEPAGDVMLVGDITEDGGGYAVEIVENDDADDDVDDGPARMLRASPKSHTLRLQFALTSRLAGFKSR